MCIYSSRLYVLLWSVALICTGLSPTYGSAPWSMSWPSLVLLLAGLGTLMLPGSLQLLRLSSVACILAWAAQMPEIPNHRWVLFYVAVTFLIKTHALPTVDVLALHVQGTLRWLTLVVYSFAVLAKLNVSYFDPTVSCAALFGQQTLDLYTHGLSLSPQAGHTTAMATTVIEALLPILLVWRRTRISAICLGVLFHIGLSLHYVKFFGNFSSSMFLLLGAWLPDATARRLYQKATEHVRAFLPAWSAAVVVLVSLSSTSLISPSDYVIARHVLFLCMALPFAVLTLPLQQTSECQKGIGAPSFLIVSLAVINALTPYLGIKTRSALTMYSNLRVEPHYSNHFFMPASLDPFGYLSDTVQILQSPSTSANANKVLQTGQLITYFMFCSMLENSKLLTSTGQVLYRRNDIVRSHTVGAPLPPDCPPWSLRKLLLFGPVGPHSHTECTW